MKPLALNSVLADAEIKWRRFHVSWHHHELLQLIGIVSGDEFALDDPDGFQAAEQGEGVDAQLAGLAYAALVPFHGKVHGLPVAEVDGDRAQALSAYVVG